MIDPQTKDRIFDAAQIADVVQDFVTLKKRGANYIGLCPFHNEKTPSFSVSPSKGIYKCFGCGKGGNAVNFIMEHEQLTYPEALKYLAKKYGIEIEERELTEEEKKLGSERESLFIVTSFASRYFANALNNSPEGIEVGLSYLSERGFKERFIKDFELGYCPDGKDNFTNDALKNGYKLEFLEKSGLTIVKENFKADRFSGRVIFPIFSLAGKVIGFGGRTLRSEKKTAKYLNSPESPIYNKSKVLYGLYQSKKTIVQKDKCYLVEGYTDVISLHQAGVENVVSSSGTSLTEDQVRLIKRFTKNVTILFDGDAAGIKASLRSIDLILEQEMNVRVVLFPDGEDPDSFSRKLNNTDFEKYLTDNEQDFIKFKIKLLYEDAKNDPIKRASMITEIVRSIALIDNSINQAVYVKECSEFLKIEERFLYAEIGKLKRRKIESERRSQQNKIQSTPSQSNIPTVPSFVDNVYYEVQEKELLRLILLYGNHKLGSYDNDSREVTVAEYIINELRNDNLEFKNLVYLKIFKLVEKLILDAVPVDESLFTKNTDPEISEISADLCSSNYILSNIWKKRGSNLPPEDTQLSIIAEDVVIKYKLKILQLGKSKIVKKIDEASKNNNTELKEAQMQKLKTLLNIMSKLSSLQDRVILR